MTLKISHLDHLVLTVRDIPATLTFYTEVLGIEIITFGEGRYALQFGNQKINLHETGHEFEPKADAPTPGSADLCFITEQSMDDIVNHLNAQKIPILVGSTPRTGAVGKINSVYLRDPDQNLIEISTYNNPNYTICNGISKRRF